MDPTAKNRVLVAAGALLLAATAWRLGLVFRHDVFWDFLAFCDVSRAVVEGLDPFDRANLNLMPWPEIPMVFPGAAFFFAPFAADPWQTDVVFLAINIVALAVALLVVLRATVLPMTGFTGASRFFAAAIAFAVFFNSNPVLTTLRHGQTTAVLTLALAAALFSRSRTVGVIGLSLAGVFKYSMLTVLGPLLLVSRKWMVCLLGFGLFVVWAATPALFGQDLFELYGGYVRQLVRQVGAEGGYNTYPESGYNLTDLSVFTSPWLSNTLKMAFVALLVVGARRRWRHGELGLNTLFAASSVTMLVSYHRVYDLVAVLPLLMAVAFDLLRRRRWPLLAVAALFLAFYLSDDYLVFKAGDLIGARTSLFGLVHRVRFGNWPQVFPLHAMAMLGLGAFSLWILFREPGAAADRPEEAKRD